MSGSTCPPSQRGPDAPDSVPLGGPFPDVRVPAGTNLLVSGPPMTGKRRLVFDALEDRRPNDAAIVVSTDDGPDHVLGALGCTSMTAVERDVGVVDCVSTERGDGPHAGPTVANAASPEDLTGIGIGFTELVREFSANAADGAVPRVAVSSLSTILHYADDRPAYRFLHAFSNRVESVGGVGLYVVNPDAHDPRDLARVKDRFDGAVRVETTEDGPRCSLHGVGGDVAGEQRDL